MTDEKRKGFELKSIGDIMKGDSKFSDVTYRRGYHQAYFQAVEDIRNGHSVEDMEKHVRTLRDWRSGYDAPLDKMVDPPNLKK